MSEVFEALLKAQREAEARRALPEAAAPAPSANGRSVKVESVAPAAPRAARRRRHMFRWLPWLRNGVSRNGAGYAIPWLVAPDHRTVVSEQFRVLRARIDTVGPGTFMITSALDQEGKTLCAVNLSVALAMGVGGGAILIDADLRRPSAGSLFGGQQRAGLLDCLTGDARWQDCLVATQYPRLKVLPAGQRTTMSAELFGSDRMRSIVAELKAEFPQHRIIFDAPPVLLTADPLVVAPYMDHIVLVVRAGVTPRRAVTKAIEALGAEKFLGVVLNDATDHISDHYYYGGRYSYSNGTPPHD